MEVLQRFKKSAQDATTVTLIPATVSFGESKPTHLAATQIVFTFTATPASLWGSSGDGREFEIIIHPKP